MTSPTQTSRTWYVPRHLVYTLLALYVLFFGLVPPLIAAIANFNNPGLFVISHLLTIAGVAFILGLSNAKAAILVLLLLLPWQPFLSMPFADTLGSTGIRMLVATKDVYAIALLPGLYLRHRQQIKWNAVDLAAAPFLLVYLLFALLSPASTFGVMVSFREGFMIVAFYLIGRFGLLDLNGIRWFLKILIAIAILVALFGYVERFFFSEDTWTALGVGEYTEAKQGVLITRYNTRGDVPKNWYTHIDGILFRRMVSGIGDPTALSRFLSLPILALLFLPGLFKKSLENVSARLIMLLLLAGALILTFGRGGLLIVMGGAMVWLLGNRPRLSFVAVPAIVLFFLAAPLFNLASASSPRGHVMSAMRGVNELFQTPLGRGLGTGGQKALFFSDEAEEGTGESYLAALAYQTGILGVLTYSFFLFMLAFNLLKMYWRSKNLRYKSVGNMALLGVSVALGVYLTSLFANAAISPISAGPSLLYCGALLTAGQNLRVLSPLAPHE